MANVTTEQILRLMRVHNIGAFIAYDPDRTDNQTKGFFTISQSRVEREEYLDLELIYSCVEKRAKELEEMFKR